MNEQLRCAVIEDGVVINVAIVADSASANDLGWVVLDDGSPVGIGWSYANGAFSAPEATEA
jgi:hypothetical protein